MRRRTVSRLALLAGLLVLPARVHAQASCSSRTSCSVGVVLRLPRPNVASLSLSSATTALPTLTAASLNAGFLDGTGPTVTVKANAPYRITIHAAQASWSYSGAAANPAKPAGDLLWSRDAGGPWMSSATSTTLWPAIGGVAPAASGLQIPLFYRAMWTWTGSPPGTYAIPVNITLTSP